MELRELTKMNFDDVIAIACALPQWFTSGGIDLIRKDIPFQKGIIAVVDNQVVGFLTFFVNQGIGTIGWMGVLLSNQRHGVGAALLSELKSQLANSGIRELLVSTLGESVEYEPYQRTRAFYRKFGFVDFKKISHPENPEQEEELLLRTKIR
jgi:GNAT superfamily N-acetyltransferase